MTLEKMTHQDLEQVLKIEKENFDDPWPEIAFTNDMKQENNELIVLKQDDEVIGYYDVWYMFDDADLNNIAIKKEHQGKKYGELLLNDCISRCREKNVGLLHLEVKIDNVKALNLYKKLGFKEVRIRKGYYAGIDGIDMVKGL